MNGYNFTERVRKVLADGEGSRGFVTNTSVPSTFCSA